MPALTPGFSIGFFSDATGGDVGSPSADLVPVKNVCVVVDGGEETDIVDSAKVDVSVCSNPSIPMMVWTIPGLISNAPLEQEQDLSLEQQNWFSPHALR